MGKRRQLATQVTAPVASTAGSSLELEVSKAATDTLALQEAVKMGLDEQDQRRQAADLAQQEVVAAILATVLNTARQMTSLEEYLIVWSVLENKPVEGGPRPRPGAVPGPNGVDVVQHKVWDGEWTLVESKTWTFPVFDGSFSAIRKFANEFVLALRKLGFDAVFHTNYGPDNSETRVFANWKHIVTKLRAAQPAKVAPNSTIIEATIARLLAGEFSAKEQGVDTQPAEPLPLEQAPPVESAVGQL